jgi:hypothetical protein
MDHGCEASDPCA